MKKYNDAESGPFSYALSNLREKFGGVISYKKGGVVIKKPNLKKNK